MARIKIKRSTTDQSTPSGLTFGELAYLPGGTGNTADRLFIGDNDTASVWIGAEIENSPQNWTNSTRLATQAATNSRISSLITSSAVTSFNGLTGSVQGVSAAVAGTGIAVSGATGSVTITNTGVQSFNGLTGSVQGVSAAVGGTGISVSGTTGSVTITNTGVQSFNGLTGQVTGASLGANTFTELNTFNAGISAAGGTFGALTRFTAGISAAGATFGGSINILSGFTAGAAAGNSFMAFYPQAASAGGGLWLQNGSMQIGGAAFGANQGSFNFNPNTERIMMFGYADINNAYTYQAGKATLRLAGSTSQNAPILAAYVLSNAILQAGFTTTNMVAGIDNTGVVFTTAGISASGGSTFAGNVSFNSTTSTTGLASFAGGISASGGMTLAGSFQGSTATFSGLGSFSVGISAAGGTLSSIFTIPSGITLQTAISFGSDRYLRISPNEFKIGTTQTPSGNGVIQLNYTTTIDSTSVPSYFQTVPLIVKGSATPFPTTKNLTEWTVGATTSACITSSGGFSGAASSFSGLITANAGISAAGGTFGALTRFTAGISAAGGITFSGTTNTLNIIASTDGAGLRIAKGIAGQPTRTGGIRLGMSDTTAFNTYLENNSGTFTVYNGVDTTGTKLADFASFANVLYGLNRFPSGLSAAGATFSGAVNFVNGLSAAGGVTFAGDIFVNGLRVGRGAGGISDNTALGADALSNNTTGVQNSAVGVNALSTNTTGGNNTAVGNNALISNTTGSANIAVGRRAMNNNTEGSENTAIGVQAMFSNSSGNYNVVVGAAALENNEGSSNVAIGYNAGTYTQDDAIINSENSIYIGANTTGLYSDDSNTIVIGTAALGDGSDTTVIGNESTTSTRVFGTLSTNGGISAAGGTFSALTRFTAGISAAGGITLAGTVSLNGQTFTNVVSSFNGDTGAVTGVSIAVAGTGIAVSGATGSVTISNIGVQSFNGSTGSVGISAGTGINITQSGTTYTIASTGGGSSKTYAVFTPLDNQPPASNFATIDTRNSIMVLDFADSSADESAIFVGVIPEGASLGSGLKVRIRWMATTATSGAVRWGAQFMNLNTDCDTDDFATATEGNTTTNTSNAGIPNTTELTVTPANIDGLAAGDFFRLKIYRKQSDTANDTMAGDAELIAVEVRSAS